jgi:hypothetical protein
LLLAEHKLVPLHALPPPSMHRFAGMFGGFAVATGLHSSPVAQQLFVDAHVVEEAHVTVVEYPRRHLAVTESQTRPVTQSCVALHESP